MMSQWTEQMICFMEDASENSSYFSRLADILQPYLSGCKYIVDAGCGLGQLSEELGKRGYFVFACDISKSAIDYVNSKNFKNVTAVHCDLETWQPCVKPDAVIFNYFGDIEKTYRIICALQPQVSLILKRNYSVHRFSIGKNIIKNSQPDTEDFFLNRNISYGKKEISLEFGQPLRNFSQALLFFNVYSKDSDKSVINNENVKNRLEKSTIPGFEYYLPQTKNSLLYILKGRL